MPLSPIIKSSRGLLHEAYLVINNEIYADISEFETNLNDLEMRLVNQAERTGMNLNTSFINFARRGIPPGAGIGFGLDRLIAYSLNRNIEEVISNGL